jgi:hypothetical protein
MFVLRSHDEMSLQSQDYLEVNLSGVVYTEQGLVFSLPDLQ